MTTKAVCDLCERIISDDDDYGDVFFSHDHGRVLHHCGICTGRIECSDDDEKCENCWHWEKGIDPPNKNWCGRDDGEQIIYGDAWCKHWVDAKTEGGCESCKWGLVEDIGDYYVCGYPSHLTSDTCGKWAPRDD